MPGKGSKIIISSEPRGVFMEGIISGTPKPGTCVQIQSGTAPVGGRFTFEVAAPGTNGAAQGVFVLLEDDLQGILATTAYVSGTRCFVYAPIAGEDLNMLLDNPGGTGTANEDTISNRLAIESGSGKLIAGGSYTSRPFMLMENLDTALSGDTLVWTKYLGNQA